MPEYTFNTDIRAVIRVQAESLEKAKEKVLELHGASIDDFVKRGYELTDFSVHHVEEFVLERNCVDRKDDTESERTSRVNGTVGSA